MRWIDQLPFGANGCSVLPYVGKDDEGFFDTGNEDVWHVYVSATAVKEMAKQLGWLSPHAHEGLVNEVEFRDQRIQQLEDELAEADKFQSNIDGLTKSGYMVKRAPGRPTKAKAA